MLYDFTVVTPTLNAEKYLRDCIQSVSEQIGVSVQHVIVDGGSNDKSIEICKERNVAFISAPGKNIYQSLNIGIRSVSSKYVCILNSDDYYPNKQTLADVMQEFNREEGSDVVYGNCRFVDSNDCQLYVQKPIKRITFAKAIAVLFVISHPSTFFRRETFDRFGYYNEDIAFASDCEYIIRLAKQGCQFGYFDQVLSVFRRHSSNLSDSEDSGLDWYKIKSIYNRKYHPVLHKLAYLGLNIHNISYLSYLINRRFGFQK